MNTNSIHNNNNNSSRQQYNPNAQLINTQKVNSNLVLRIAKPSHSSFTLQSIKTVSLKELFSEIEDKKNKITLLTKTNSKQQKALQMLTKQIDEIESSDSLQMSNSKEEDILMSRDIQLSLETEKLLSNAISQINILSKNNNLIKKDAGFLDDYQYKLEVIDQNKIKAGQIEDLNNEIKYLSKEVEEHKECLTQREIFTSKLKAIKDEIRKSKKTYYSLKQKLNEVESKYHKATTTNNEKHIGTIKQLFLDASSKRSLSTVSLSVKNIINKSFPYPNALLSNEERLLIQEKMNNDNEYTELMTKISKLETMRSSIESKQNQEIRECKSKLVNIMEEIEELVNKNRKKESKNRILLNTLNELKIEQKGLQKKLKDLQCQSDASTKNLKDKNQELYLLTHQYASLKKLTQIDNVIVGEKEINNFMAKINKQDAFCQFDGNITDNA